MNARGAGNEEEEEENREEERRLLGFSDKTSQFRPYRIKEGMVGGRKGEWRTGRGDTGEDGERGE